MCPLPNRLEVFVNINMLGLTVTDDFCAIL